VEISKKDRLVLINQYRILASLDKDQEAHYQELIEILENGYSIFYSQLHAWISDDMPPEAGALVLRILDLYRAIEDVKRSSEDNRLLEHHLSFFRGFDGNNETEYMGFCRFLIQTQGKFQEQEQYLLRNDNLNSHMPMVETYQRMLNAAGTLKSIWNMSPDQDSPPHRYRD
jgi:uncharacterized protein YfbU (UPF0304 family)